MEYIQRTVFTSSITDEIVLKVSIMTLSPFSIYGLSFMIAMLFSHTIQSYIAMYLIDVVILTLCNKLLINYMIPTLVIGPGRVTLESHDRKRIKAVANVEIISIGKTNIEKKLLFNSTSKNDIKLGLFNGEGYTYIYVDDPENKLLGLVEDIQSRN